MARHEMPFEQAASRERPNGLLCKAGTRTEETARPSVFDAPARTASLNRKQKPGISEDAGLPVACFLPNSVMK
jgi:hypothetical protein